MGIWFNTLEILFNEGGMAGRTLQFIFAVLALFTGGIFAMLIAGAVRSRLRKMELGKKLSKYLPEDTEHAGGNIEKWIPRIVFYLLLILDFFIVLDILGLEQAGKPFDALLTKISEYGANLLGAGILLLTAWLAATILRYLSASAMNMFSLDERFDSLMGKASRKDEEKIDMHEGISISSVLAECLYWIVFFSFLPGILDVLKLGSVLSPILKMQEKILLFLPGLAAGTAMFLAGLFCAKILRKVVSNLLTVGRVNTLFDSAGLTGAFGKSGIAGFAGIAVYTLVLIPTFAAAADALGIESVSAPARNLMEKILGAGADLLGAGLLLFFGYLAGFILANLFSKILENMNFDTLFDGFGLHFGKEEKYTPARLAGKFLLVVLLVLALSGACDIAGLPHAADKVALLLPFLGKLVFGLGIFLTGSLLANRIYTMLSRDSSNEWTAWIARIGILFFSGAFALNALGIANGVIVTGFALILGAFSLAFALAFGLGGRSFAEEKLAEWKRRFNRESAEK